MRIFGILALLALPAAGQLQQAKESPSGQVAKFSANSNLVIVDVMVRDKSGKPIEGLKPDDFTVLEDGKPQKVSVFEFQKLSSEPEPPPRLSLADQLKLPEAPRTTITAEKPGEVQYHDKRLMVFYLDFSSMGIPEQLRAQEAALEYLDKHITKDDMVAILLYTSMVQVLTDFHQRPRRADEHSQSAAHRRDERTGRPGGYRRCQRRRYRRGLRRRRNRVQHLQYRPKAGGHRTSGAHAGPAAGEEGADLFLGGVNKTGIDNQAQLEATINAAVKANLAIYPIDARGLMADPPGGGASKAASRGTGIFNGSVYNQQRATINDSQETLYTLAADTGGKAFFDSNDITAGIVQAQQRDAQLLSARLLHH